MDTAVRWFLNDSSAELAGCALVDVLLHYYLGRVAPSPATVAFLLQRIASGSIEVGGRPGHEVLVGRLLVSVLGCSPTDIRLEDRSPPSPSDWWMLSRYAAAEQPLPPGIPNPEAVARAACVSLNRADFVPAARQLVTLASHPGASAPGFSAHLRRFLAQASDWIGDIAVTFDSPRLAWERRVLDIVRAEG